MRCVILAAALLVAVSPVSQAGQIYKWVDAQGVTHFDAQPPAGQSAQQVDIQHAPPASTPAVSATSNPQDEQQAIDAKVKQQVATQEAKRQAFCETVRTNLAQLQNNPHVREQVGTELKRLNEEERQTRIAETQKSIADNCQ
jgi:hypothetical protein